MVDGCGDDVGEWMGNRWAVADFWIATHQKKQMERKKNERIVAKHVT